jgi:hypothetical protein
MAAEGAERGKLSIYVRFWITEEQNQAVHRLAKDRQLTAADIHRAALRFYLKAQKHPASKQRAEAEVAELALV